MMNRIALICRIIETATTMLGIVYFIDIQTDGDLDLPHIKGKLHIARNLKRVWRKIKQ